MSHLDGLRMLNQMFNVFWGLNTLKRIVNKHVFIEIDLCMIFVENEVEYTCTSIRGSYDRNHHFCHRYEIHLLRLPHFVACALCYF